MTTNTLIVRKVINVEPVKTHGGPARGIHWELVLNDILIEHEFERYRWETPPDLCIWPSRMELLANAIARALKVKVQHVNQRR